MRSGAADGPCHRPLQVGLEVQRGQEDRRDPGPRHVRLGPAALSHPRSTKMFYFKSYTYKPHIKTLFSGTTYSQEHLSLQQDLEDPEDQVYQINQLGRLDQHYLFHQENPSSIEKKKKIIL